jgi:hypothetical protein
MKRGTFLWASLIVAFMVIPSPAIAWAWVQNPPQITDHSNWQNINDDAGAGANEVDNIEGQGTDVAMYTGGPINNPEQIRMGVYNYLVWELAYDLTAQLTQNSLFSGARAEVHWYLYYLSSGQWTLVRNDWVCVESLVKGQTVSESGGLHLYHNGHNYQPGDNYEVYVNMTCSHRNGINWVIHNPHVCFGYYRLVP